MQVEILTVGDEVLEGQTVNSNGAFLGAHLFEMGYLVEKLSVVPDAPDAIRDAMQEALSRSALTIVTGGLGPTIDDLTKGIAAECMGRPVRFDRELYAELRKRYPDTEATKNQALVPEGAVLLKNKIGSASGLFLHSEHGSLLLLPGPPREMEPMFQEEAASLIKRIFPLENPPKILRLSLCKANELDLDPLLRKIRTEHPDAEIGIYPSYGTLQARFRVKERFERLSLFEKEIREAFPTHLFFEPTIAAAVHKSLIETKKTLALAESCTGGAISARLTAFDGASQYLLGSMVVYSNEWKKQFLGVRQETLQVHGAVSREAVLEMAEGLLKATGADTAIAVSGIAGPTGGTPQKPVGTVYIAVAKKGEPVDAGKAPLMLRSRSSVIEYAVQSSLCALYRSIVYGAKSFS